MDEAIEEACIAAGETIDILAMDACLMHLLEVDYELREHVDYIVASEETIPGDGYPYNLMIGSLCASPTQSASAYAIDMVDDYHSSYPSSQDTTLSAVDVTSSSITNLMNAFNLFVGELRNQVTAGQTSSLKSARSASQEFYYDIFVDLYDFAFEANDRISDTDFQVSCMNLMLNISAAVLNSKQHNNPQANGIAIYFPEAKSDYDSGYETVIDLGQETDWDAFLKEFYDGPTLSLKVTSYLYNDSAAADPDGIVDQGETVNLSVTVKNAGSFPATSVNGTLSCFDGNITILTNFQDYGSLGVGVSNTLDFVFNVSNSAPNALVVKFYLLINGTYSVNYVKNETLYLIVNVSTIFGGDSFTNAVEIGEGVVNSIMPGLDPTDLSAWFKIKVNISMYLIASILTAEIGTDFDIYVYHPSGSLLTAAAIAFYPDTCSTIAPVTGYYRLRIHPYTGTGVYTLNVTISNTTGPEDGNAWGTAISFYENHTTATGSCPNPSSATGYMYYRVYLTENQGIKVTINGDSSQHDFDIYIVDSNFQVVANSYDYSYPESISYITRQDGYIYIIIVPYSGSGSFSISVEFIEVSPLPEWILWIIIIGIALAVIGGIYLFFKISR